MLFEIRKSYSIVHPSQFAQETDSKEEKNTSSHGVNMKITARIDMAFKQLVSNVMHLVSRAMTDIHKWRLCELNNRNKNNKQKNQQHQQIYKTFR